jgi:hypothetical protein
MPIERKFTANDVRDAIGKTATINDLQTYLANNVAGEVKRMIEAEKMPTRATVGAKAVHLSFSWG